MAAPNIERSGNLLLNVEPRWFIEIEENIKPLDFRVNSSKWYERLHNTDGTAKQFDRVIIRNKETGEILVRPFGGFFTSQINHPHFHSNLEAVFVIILAPDWVDYYKQMLPEISEAVQ